MFEKEEKNGNAVLRIRGSMSVFDITSIHKELLACLDSYEDLTVNLKGLDFCDISGLQLLYSARKTAQSIGKAFSVDGTPDSIIDIFNRAGLDPDTVLEKNKNSKSKKR